MGILEAIRSALASLRQNRLRTALTMLGITFGVSAVVCTVALGQGGQMQVQRQLQNLGDNLIWIEAGARNVNGRRTGAYGTKSLMLGDEQAVAQLPEIKACSPHVDSNIQIAYGNQNWRTHFRGVAPTFFQIEHWVVARGSAFTNSDVEHMAKVCIIGQTVVRQLFPHTNPIGKTIRVGDLPVQVVGVFASKGASGFGFDQDDVVMMPYTVVMKEIKGQYWLDDIMCSAISPAAIPPAETRIGRMLRLRHGLLPSEGDDFNIRHPDSRLQALKESDLTFAYMLAGVAMLALLVGGVGIMNIMLVSVTERTREIGLRMAVGASEWDVQRQFLLESVTLSVLGGAAGVALGVILTEGLTSALAWPATISVEAIVAAVVVSIATGVFFGYYPARRAASLNPIEALRYE